MSNKTKATKNDGRILKNLNFVFRLIAIELTNLKSVACLFNSSRYNGLHIFTKQLLIFWSAFQSVFNFSAFRSFFADRNKKQVSFKAV